MRLELGEVVDSVLAVGGSDHVCWVLADIGGNLAPSSLDSSNGVGQSAILFKAVVSLMLCVVLIATHHVKENGLGVECRDWGRHCVLESMRRGMRDRCSGGYES